MSAERPPAPSRRQAVFALGAGLSVSMASPERAQAAAPVASFSLLLVNDIYRMGDQNGRGGFARLAAIVKAERARGVPMLFCHAGDTFSPSLMSGFDKGDHIVELLNLIRPDVFVPGNHEFDFGVETFLQRMRDSRFPYYGANMRWPDGSRLPNMRDTELVRLGPVTIGIVGIALADTPRKAQSGDVRFGPELEILQARAAELRAAGADLIVAVTHTDREVDNLIVRSRVCDILLTGHDHDLAIGFDGKTVMVESSEEGYFVTSIDVVATVTGEGQARKVAWAPSFRVHDSSAFDPDPEVGAVVRRLQGELSRELDVEIGETAFELDSRTTIVRTQEAAIGNLVADAVRASTEADVAIYNGGGIRSNFTYAAGTRLTRRDVLSELPFANTTVMAQLTGAQLRALLENGFSQIGTPSGRFPQVSGLRLVVDRQAPAGSRLVSVEVNGEPLALDRRYKVGANNFMYSGGDGYGGLAAGRTFIGLTDGQYVANEVMAHVRRLGVVRTGIEGRIIIR